ncbi:octopamine receptor Oamb [Phlebotomus argentipes]|uniref:octopamine receptor Oamb n=1 Tax=Phlebotomus argentipes TaxID=94469 RepID=UPI002892F07F|nr:octopamine receptor Oamb [Phlebotomus argentipes]XP_059611090.1 octopamine receptor Oamb [Phlebotomus argentipes]
MNQTECSKLIEAVEWTEPGNLVSLAVLAVINVLVIVGNCLVIAAVFCSHKLRSVTNFFIVSLAVADLLVGLAVLPFSATWEVFKVWIFGDLWCRIWLAVDVWMCTASILNLCAISLDRYVAVTRPVTYPSIMSTTKAKSLIAGIWVLSFVICFPPLVGWKDQKLPADLTYRVGNYTLISVTPPPEPPPPCPWTCELTNDAGYVVYSALGSFYIPMLVMLFFYWRIYRAAVRTTRAINQGFKTTKGSKGIGNRFDEQRLTLRIHRGRGSNLHESPHSNGSTHSTSTNVSASPDRHSRFSTRNKHEKIKISVSYPSSENLASPTNANPNALYAVHYSSNGKDTSASKIFRGSKDGFLQVVKSMPDIEKEAGKFNSPRTSRKMGKRNIKAQVKRFRMETKAAKTLAIIVGLFILCWLPFFTVYVIRAFCAECIHPVLFSVIFWLGYCNSAVNPMIYALFSKDFRFAFKRIICRCFCAGPGPNTATSRRGSDMSQVKVRTPSISPSANAQSICDDSDPIVELSDSR